MPRKSISLSLLAVLAAACGQSGGVSCPAVDQVQCVDSSVSYDNGVGKLINQGCFPCHAPGGIEATRPLTDYERVFGERMSIAEQLVTCSMPPAGNPQLSSENRAQILGWLSCGAPQ